MTVSEQDILKANILIVDDQEANVDLLEQMLYAAGYTAISSTIDPLEVCELHREHGYDLILLDLQMPGMDGYTTAREIRHWEALQPEGHRTPLVALSADAVLDVQERCDAAGMDDIIGKPVDLQALRETLERHLPELALA